MPPAADIQRLAAEVYSAYKSYISSKPHKSYKTFRIETKRSDKSFPLTSQELNKGLGEFIRKKTKMKVDLGNPDLTFFLEITRGNICVYFEKIKGLSGLPTGVSGQALSLISSGIDSPVAAWYLMKRGVSVDFVHFHSWPQTNRASIENVKKIIGVLRHYQNDCRLYLAPFWDIQKDIIKKAPEDYRVIMYRYFMFQIAAAIADKTNKFCRINKIYGALATGESLGQVASQTLDNIYALHNARNAADVPRKGVKKRGVPRSILPILQPLIGMNKEEIIEKAKQIGTYEFSIKPYDDCCGFFVPKHPVTKAESGTILKIAKSVNRNRELIEQILDKIEIVNYNL